MNIELIYRMPSTESALTLKWRATHKGLGDLCCLDNEVDSVLKLETEVIK